MSSKPPILDPSVIGQLRSDVGADAMPVLMDALRREFSMSIATIRSSFEGSDLALLETTAHALKSSSASFGALRLSEACLKLEEAARSKVDKAEIKALISTMEHAIVEVSPLFGFDRNR